MLRNEASKILREGTLSPLFLAEDFSELGLWEILWLSAFIYWSALFHSRAPFTLVMFNAERTLRLRTCG